MNGAVAVRAGADRLLDSRPVFSLTDVRETSGEGVGVTDKAGGKELRHVCRVL
jgi:hypothetical protein